MIEKGNTQPGVNKAIIEFLQKNFRDPQHAFSLFDIPCGSGEFLRSLKRYFPNANILGQDLYATPVDEIKSCFIRGDAKDFSSVKNKKFDVITSVSGVMVFDDITGLFANASANLNSSGIFIVTNDNVLTLRDRISFLFFGRLKRFKLLYSRDEGNWNLLLIQALWRLFIQNNFKIEKIIYTTIRTEDFFLLPFAIFLYPFQLLYLFFARSELTFRERVALFPFTSLLARHYVIFGRK